MRTDFQRLQLSAQIWLSCDNVTTNLFRMRPLIYTYMTLKSLYHRHGETSISMVFTNGCMAKLRSIHDLSHSLYLGSQFRSCWKLQKEQTILTKFYLSEV